MFLMLELCEQNLAERLKAKGKFTESEAVKVLKQVVAGCLHLLSRGVVHRDIKPENILFQGAVAKLADFGMSDIDGWSSIIGGGTRLYSAP